MKSFFKYKDLIMSTGLIPIIVCMIFCQFVQDAFVLYSCSAASLVYMLYRTVKPTLNRPNWVLVHGTLALIVLSFIKAISKDQLIPEQTVPITLEILFLCFSLFFLIVPDCYDRLYPDKTFSILNRLETKAIVILSGIQLLTYSLIYLFFSPLSHKALYAMMHIFPPLCYLLCLVANYILVKAFCSIFLNMPVLRIIPVCNGKIYVIHNKEFNQWDTPLEDCMDARQIDRDLYAKEIMERYREHLDDEPSPRFCLKHLVKNPPMDNTFLLYILPLNDERQIHFNGGKFVTPEEIEETPKSYSYYLREEINHLKVAARMWEEYS